ncbi:hypothetical protein DXG03_008375 [Asterophora parasitica]|uniref:Fungal-type protein kinase domain-containing protein n=1 Tax=Asterophora parasitica TaxID=117018 RepID=A0A9P7G455_9AGAR|nr:hypothetical protein DXG03_008375 [Asterophora parasitica]
MMLLEKADTRGLPSLIEAYHDIQGSDGKPFSTFHTVRSGMVPNLWELNTSSEAPATAKKVRGESDHDAELRWYFSAMLPLAVVEKYSRLSQTPNYSPVDRIHTQILLPLGMPIQHSKDLLELLGCFLGFMKDDRHAHINGVVHRDVSSGNVLIVFDTGGKAVGRLMDYDHAKRALTSIDIPTEEHEPDMIEMTRTVIARQSRPPIPFFTEEAVVEASRYFDQGQLGLPTIYAAATYRMRNPSRKSSEEISKEDLGWNHEDIKWPDFSRREARKGHRSGTLPFMSAEVLAGKSFFTNLTWSQEPFIHTSVHDVESFLWVLVHICLTRRGPGIDMGRDELNPNHDRYDKHAPLLEILRECFDGDAGTLKTTKEKFYVDFDLFKTKILDHFHPYFAPLKSLVRQWWEILVHAYKFRANEYYHIHDHIIRLLETAISRLKEDPTSWAQKEDTDREVERRAELRENTRQKLYKLRTGFAPLVDTDTTSPASPLLSATLQGSPPLSAAPDSPTRRPAKRRRNLA